MVGFRKHLSTNHIDVSKDMFYGGITSKRTIKGQPGPFSVAI